MEALIEKFLMISSGDGSGSGYGYGIKTFNGKKVYSVDSVQTIIYSVKNNIAKGAILNTDLILKDCYIARSGNYFAHGDTIQQAVSDASAKEMQNIPVEERIAKFNSQFQNGKKYPAIEFYNWHTTLTGSCKTGKDSFIHNNGSLFDAAGYCYSEQEMKEFARDDGRPKSWLIYEHAKKISGYES